MPRITRRLFLQHASLGLAAVGGAVALPHAAGAAPLRSAAASTAKANAAPAAAAKSASEPVVAYVRDAQVGEMSLFVGTREVRFRDPALVRRLIEAGA